MRHIFFLVLVILFSYACTPCSHCASKSNYLKKVDSTRPYNIDSKYCIANIKDTLLENGMGIVKLNVFDRISGDYVKEGVSGFYNSTDTFKLYFNQDTTFKKLPVGNYIIYVGSLKSLGITTKKIQVRENTKTDINFYLGSILQW